MSSLNLVGGKVFRATVTATFEFAAPMALDENTAAQLALASVTIVGVSQNNLKLLTAGAVLVTPELLEKDAQARREAEQRLRDGVLGRAGQA